MARINNIYVDGYSSASSTPVIDNMNPVITWEFIDVTSSVDQAAFDIRIGSGDTHLGSSLYAGDYLDETGIQSQASVFEFIDHNLERGKTYGCQVRVRTTDHDYTPWKGTTFRVNRLPYLVGCRLSPANPTIFGHIDLLYSYFHLDDNEESGTKVRWYKNGILQPEHNDVHTVSLSYLRANDSWLARVTPSDGISFGEVYETNTVTVSGAAQTYGTVTITPASPTVDDVLRASYDITGFSSEYDEVDLTDSETVIIWKKNGVIVDDENQEYIRLSMSAGDVITAVGQLTINDLTILQNESSAKIIASPSWYIYNLKVNGSSEAIEIADLTPVLEWQVYKSDEDTKDRPTYRRVLVTKTPAIDGPVYDSGLEEYKGDTAVIPPSVLELGQSYYVHVGVADSGPIDDVDDFTSARITVSGSSWEENVSNSTGWTIEFKLSLESSSDNMGLYIHDGTYFCSLVFSNRSITFVSDTAVIYNYPSSEPGLTSPKVFRVSAQGDDLKVFIRNQLVIDAVGLLTNRSNTRSLEYGDIDSKAGGGTTAGSNTATWYFFRYTTNGAAGFAGATVNLNTRYFERVGQLLGGSIDFIHDNLIAWTPATSTESTKLIRFNENAETYRLQAVLKNYSPISSIHIDRDRRKYIGTANGVNVVYGEKHDKDYTLTTEPPMDIAASDFDRVSNVPDSQLSFVEPSVKDDWMTFDTRDGNHFEPYGPYGPYGPFSSGPSNIIHYYSQRVPGHSWFDNVDNATGWQVSFSLQVDRIEVDDSVASGVQSRGFVLYVNDGTYQEIISFQEDRIHLMNADVYSLVNNRTARDFVLSVKGTNLYIYQRVNEGYTGSYQLILDGSGLFNTAATKEGNSRKPRSAVDSSGYQHVVWHDDGNLRSQIFYSTFDGTSWSNPELVTEDVQFNLRNPAVALDSNDRVWVVFEDTSWGPTEIAAVVKDDAGWNPKIRLTNNDSQKGNPDIAIDRYDNVHVVWEDKRHGNWQILWAEWNNERLAWLSSGQFGQDTAVMRDAWENPYDDRSRSYRNPRLSISHPFMWLVCDAREINNEDSIILMGYRHLTTRNWHSAGTTVFNSSGEVTETNVVATIVSDTGNFAYRPCVASDGSRVIVVWEDQTSEVYQIYGKAFNNLGTALTDDPVQVTNSTTSCIKPSIGSIQDDFLFVFEDGDNHIRSATYTSADDTFHGSATDGSNPDTLIELSSGRIPSNPDLPPIMSISLGSDLTTRVVYDYRILDEEITEYDEYVTEYTEYGLQTTTRTQEEDAELSIPLPDFQMIGDVSIAWSNLLSPPTPTSLDDGNVSSLDKKEFAFGDIDRSVGVLVHIKDPSLYFGYDATPYSIGSFNSSTVDNWPDDRINDVFSDVYGNIVAATFSGLAYYNTSTLELTLINDSVFGSKICTAIQWGGDGKWFLGTTTGSYVSPDAGSTWTALGATDKVYCIAMDSDGNAVMGTSNGIKIYSSTGLVASVSSPFSSTSIIKCVAVDEDDIIWAGTDAGLFRVKSRTEVMTFDRRNGMRSSHVNDITIVSRYLRYVATATGIERMYGTRFANLDVGSIGLANNNVSRVLWNSDTGSLWVGCLHSLHEIIFRDPTHEIIDDEISQYSSSELLTTEDNDLRTFYVLEVDSVVQSEEALNFTNESAEVYLNRQKIELGYVVDEAGQAIVFGCDMLATDQVEVGLSNKFTQIHDFNQSQIEQDVLGFKRTEVTKIDESSRNQILMMSSSSTRPEVMLYAGEVSLPFTTIMIDRDAPEGCLKDAEFLSRTKVRFRLLAYDAVSGVDSYQLSNYENFTSDGETALAWQTYETPVVTHDLGESLNNVSESIAFPTTVLIDNVEYDVGTGAALAVYSSQSTEGTTTDYLLAATSQPVIIYRFDPGTEAWTAIQAIDFADDEREVTGMATINNVVYMTTGTDKAGGRGGIYHAIPGEDFELIRSVSGSYARGIAAGPDGAVYFGSSDGTIYEYKDGSTTAKYEAVAESIYSLDVFEDILVVATGTKGRVYSIDLASGSQFIVYDGPETHMSHAFISQTGISSPEQARLYCGSGQYTSIYRSNMDSFDFSRTYSSFGKTINQIRDVSTDVLTLRTSESTTTVTGNTTVAAVGADLFKHVMPPWEFVYHHGEQIHDFIEYKPGTANNGIWVISDSGVTKWTNLLLDKTVYMRLKDKAGNVSTLPDTTTTCPDEDADGNPVEGACCQAYSISIDDLKDFVYDSRIVDVDEYGAVTNSFGTTSTATLFSGDRIDEEVGIYTSEIFNGTNDLVSWKSITWTSTEPAGTEVVIQIRSGADETTVASATWSDDLTKNDYGYVSIEHITDQYFQFRLVLRSEVRSLSPSVTSVLIRSLTTQASHFFTTNFVLPARPTKGIIEANTFLPVSSDIVFGINTHDSVDFAEYQVVELNRLFNIRDSQFGTNLRVGAKLVSPGLVAIDATEVSPGDPYDAGSYICTIDFEHTNTTASAKDYHFRIKFYQDIYHTQLDQSFFSGNDQTGWQFDNGDVHTFPSAGVELSAGESMAFSFTPGDLVSTTRKWYIEIEAYDGSSYDTLVDNRSFVCNDCNITNESGLVGTYYKTGLPTLTTIPDLGQYVPDHTTEETDVNFPLTTTAWTTSAGETLAGYVDNFAARFRGKVYAPLAGEYEFIVQSRDGSRLFIDNVEVVTHDGIHGFTEETGLVELDAGYHEFELQFFNATNEAGIIVSWKKPGDTVSEVIPSTRFYHEEINEYCDNTTSPKLYNFVIMFTCDNGETVKLNLTS